MQASIKTSLLFLLCFLMCFKSQAQPVDNKIVIVIIDGARYTETFGDSYHTFIPKMWALSQQGTVINKFYNNYFTYTSKAFPALYCGAWTDVEDIVYNGSSTSHSVLPTIFEYYRKSKNVPSAECFFISESFESIWLPSLDPDYGENYWPEFNAVGHSDKEVAIQALTVMANNHPHLTWVYLDDVDHSGHSGSRTDYLKAIYTSDKIIGVIWDWIQSDPFYQNTTTLIVTNDHGRHDDQNGGFQGHGCDCEGCRHIQFLAIGPTIKQNFLSSKYRTIPDLTVTACFLLGVQPTKTTGSVMYEILNSENNK